MIRLLFERFEDTLNRISGKRPVIHGHIGLFENDHVVSAT